MVKLGVIKYTKEPTHSVIPMVIFRKRRKIQLNIDPSELNKNILRPHYPLNTLEKISALIIRSKYFTLLHCKRGFWQIYVTEGTQKYLTFSTPWGPFFVQTFVWDLISTGVLSGNYNTLNKGIPNVQCSMDDILFYADSWETLKKLTNKDIETLKRKKDSAKYKKNLFTKPSHTIEVLQKKEYQSTIVRPKRYKVSGLQRFMITY